MSSHVKRKTSLKVAALSEEFPICCRDLWKTYDGKVSAVRGINIKVKRGECYGLLGPNGAGKTTTIEILEGLLSPTSGEVRILNHSWDKSASKLRRWIGVSLQETRLSEKLTVRETIELFSSFYPQSRPATKIMGDLALVDKADSWVGILSGGQLQRLAVAVALVGNPKVLFLDEPTTGLDPESRRDLWTVIRRYIELGGTALLTTHYMEEAQRVCDRVGIIDQGKMVAEGRPCDLIFRFGGLHILEFALMEGCDDALLETWPTLPSVESARIENGLYSLNVREPHVTIPALLEAIGRRKSQLRHLTIRQPSLEDVFLSLTGRRLNPRRTAPSVASH